MAIGYHASWADALLNAILRSTNPPSGYVCGYYKLGVTGVSIAKNKTIGAGSWGTASAGMATLTVPQLMTHQNNGTISHLDIADSGQTRTLLTGLDVALAGTGAHCHVDDVNITAAEACNITEFKFNWLESNPGATLAINTALRNKLIDIYTSKLTTHISANATVKVYTGTAPDVNSAATGTELISFPIDTTSSFTYGAAASSVSTPTLVAANASNTGDAGYARFAWTHSATDYVIQGSIGTSGTDFIISATSLTSGNSYNFTTANTMTI